MKPFKPTKEDLADAINRKVPDVIAPNLKVLFVGINPGIYTAAAGKHFAHPANRFWKALHAGGFTPRLFSPFENERLLNLGYGITNIVERPTLMAKEVSRNELEHGWRELEKKVKKYQPRWLAICGIGAYQLLFGKKAGVGEQNEKIGETKIWLLPNPSGLSASFTPAKLAEVFMEFKSRIGDVSMDNQSSAIGNYLFEMISKQVLQTVISPGAVEKRWPDIQKAFRMFDIYQVSKMGGEDIEKLLDDTRIIRNQKKIRATIENAQELRELCIRYGSIENYIRSYPERAKLIDDLTSRIRYVGRLSVEKALQQFEEKYQL